ncbi:MAG: Cof-type HAD-IIB family hydrolase [Clostridia bacterium]|nr:Cof-type HAD-IIB family hydrolase [Clostridia bacterium]
MSIKMIAADLDGTLLNTHSQLSAYTREVLARCAAQNIKLVAATGRAYTAMPACIAESDLFDYAVTSNGAAIYDMHRKALLQDFVLPADSARQLIDFALQERLGLELICEGSAYGEGYYFDHPEAFLFNQRSIDYLRSTRTKIDDLEAFLATRLARLQSIDFVLPAGREKESIAAQFARNIELYITSSHARILEFSAAGCGKANALRYLLEREGTTADALACFGNAENDLEMIQLAAVGAAVANSPPEVLKQVPLHCGDCNADGVAKFIEESLHL